VTLHFNTASPMLPSQLARLYAQVPASGNPLLVDADDATHHATSTNRRRKANAVTSPVQMPPAKRSRSIAPGSSVTTTPNPPVPSTTETPQSRRQLTDREQMKDLLDHVLGSRQSSVKANSQVTASTSTSLMTASTSTSLMTAYPSTSLTALLAQASPHVRAKLSPHARTTLLGAESTAQFNRNHAVGSKGPVTPLSNLTTTLWTCQIHELFRMDFQLDRDFISGLKGPLNVTLGDSRIKNVHND
jgi:hypothetical protein